MENKCEKIGFKHAWKRKVFDEKKKSTRFFLGQFEPIIREYFYYEECENCQLKKVDMEETKTWVQYSDGRIEHENIKNALKNDFNFEKVFPNI